MKSKKTLVVAGGLAVFAAWFAFRPELLFIDQAISEPLPAAAADSHRTLASGTFRGLAHETTGSASIIETDNGRILRLSDFMTSNGPDVHVYLVAAADAPDDATVTRAGFVDLGSIKGNIGDQNYEVPTSVDLNRYQAVSIWCARFNVNFGAAALARSE